MNKLSKVSITILVLLVLTGGMFSSTSVFAQQVITDLVEQAWGEAGAVAYQAAAEVMLKRNGSSQKLDDFQKNILRPRYGSLVDSVNIIYSATMMEKWCGLGKCLPLDESAGQTYCNRIYIDDPYKPRDIDQVLLLAHELRHSQQCKELGGEGKFGFHYFREYKRANQSYKNNDMEKDARKVANAVMKQFWSGASTSALSTPSPNRGAKLVADRTNIGGWETFELVYLGNTKYALKAHNGMFVSAEDGGGGPVVANRTNIGVWETFEFVDLGNRKIALKSHNGMFVSAEDGGGGPVVANRTKIGVWETFETVPLNNNRLALKVSNGLYVCADSNAQ